MCDDRCGKCGCEFHGATLLSGRLVDGSILCPICVQNRQVENRKRLAHEREKQPPESGPTIYRCPFCDEESRDKPGAFFHYATCDRVPGRDNRSASIEEAAFDFAKLTHEYHRSMMAGKCPAPLPEIREILHRHFGTASRAQRAWEIWEQHWQEWFIHCIAAGWEVGSGLTSLAIAPDPVTAILRAAGEEGDQT